MIRRLLGRLSQHVRRFRRATSANVAIIFAVTLPLTLGAGALVAEYGNAMLVNGKTQRVADLAAFSAALAYSSGNSEADMRAAGQHVAVLNGLAANEVTLTLVPSPQDSTKQAVRAGVAVSNQLFLAPVLGVDTALTIRSTAFAQVGSGGTASCILALAASGTGVTLSGGTAITATNCAVASNNTVTVPCGTSITAKEVGYNSASAPSQPCNGINASSVKKGETLDPFAGHAGITAARSRFTSVAALTSPAAPVLAAVPNGTDIEFGWNTSATQNAASSIGCSASKPSSTWILTCPDGGTYNFGTISIGGGLMLDFAVAGKRSTYNFSGSINLSSNAVRFGDGTYNVRGSVQFTNYGTYTLGTGAYNIGGNLQITGSSAVTFSAANFNIGGGIKTEGSTQTTFGSGIFRIGRGTLSCNGGYYSICHQGNRLTIAGPSTFEFNSGFFNNGGSSLYLGEGSTNNSFKIGTASTGNAIWLGGGSQTFLRDATGAGVFQVIGNIDASSGGGSCFVVSAAPQHDITGNFSGAGGIILGAGVYTIDGYFALGANGGGGSNCSGQTVSVLAEGVTLVLSGRNTFPWGDCAGKAFCATAGYSNIRLTAPSSGALAKIAVIGPSGNANGAIFTAGASGGKISGAFYFPKGAITMSGGAGASGGSDCLQMVGTQVSLSGGTTLASECVAAAGGGGGGSTVSLVQ